jgi:hypothetical protein
MESLGLQRSVYLWLPMLADAVTDCENDCLVRYDRGRRWVAAESSLGYSSEVSYCAALSDTVAYVAHNEERMNERGRKEGKGKGNWDL